MSPETGNVRLQMIAEGLLLQICPAFRHERRVAQFITSKYDSQPSRILFCGLSFFQIFIGDRGTSLVKGDLQKQNANRVSGILTNLIIDLKIYSQGFKNL